MRYFNFAQLILLFIIGVTTAVPVSADGGDDWVAWKTIEDLSVSLKNNPSTDIESIRIETIIDQPFEVICSILDDVSSHPKWVHACFKATTEHDKRTKTDQQYYSFDIPWPFQDREIFMSVTTRLDLTRGMLAIDGHAIDPESHPKTEGLYRVTKSENRFTAERLSPGKTRVVFISNVETGLRAPRILKQFISRQIPILTIKKMRQIAGDPLYLQLAQKKYGYQPLYAKTVRPEDHKPEVSPASSPARSPHKNAS